MITSNRVWENDKMADKVEIEQNHHSLNVKKITEVMAELKRLRLNKLRLDHDPFVALKSIAWETVELESRFVERMR